MTGICLIIFHVMGYVHVLVTFTGWLAFAHSDIFRLLYYNFCTFLKNRIEIPNICIKNVLSNKGKADIYELRNSCEKLFCLLLNQMKHPV